jgi:hypothetical protein
MDTSMGSQPQKCKCLRKCFDVSQFIELFSLVILFKKIILSSTNDGGMIKTEKRQIALAT